MKDSAEFSIILAECFGMVGKYLVFFKSNFGILLMLIQLSSHARKRMEERGVVEEEVMTTLQSPQKRGYKGDTSLAMKIRPNGHLLIVIYREIQDIKYVITVIDTSKVSKYL